MLPPGLYLAALLPLLTASAVAAQPAGLPPADATSAEAQLAEVQNFQRVSDRLASSGQIAYDQIGTLGAAGYEVVVNLAPASRSANALEGFLVAEQGLAYVHMPVSWREPTLRDLDLFFEVMEASAGRRVYVHCQANMRASVFVYLYRTLVEGVPEAEARATLLEIWDPAGEPQWAALIEQAREAYASR